MGLPSAIEILQQINESLGNVFTWAFGSRNNRVLARLSPVIKSIAEFEPELVKLDDEALKARTATLKARVADGATLDELLPEAFAVVREASKRAIGLRHYDVQMIGAILLHRGTVIEMMTGEGKTLVATCPAYLNALSGKGVHVVTVNDYLAKRDSEWMGKVYEFLGLKVGCLQSNVDEPELRRAQYEADITYGTNSEFGFDYLRDNMKVHLSDLVQRELNYTIVDEVDSILIDEARTPLIISGPADISDEKYLTCDQLARKLKKDEHFGIDEKETTITLTDEGVSECERLLGIENLYSRDNLDIPHFLNNALRAHNLFRKDRDYVTQGGEIVIVDEHTGRLMEGRRWSDGLHQAVEVKEGMPLKRESQTHATITLQNFFKLYSKLSGMTGTALTEASEFLKIYKLDVVAVPPNRPCVRKDSPDLVYGTETEKYAAIVAEIADRHQRGQPVLVGTASIETNERLSALLEKAGIPHNVLNAKQHQREALTVAQAGSKGAVTVATNMAGRGTDIVLGGNAEIMARAELGPEASEEEILERAKARRDSFQKDREEILSLGGLFVLGTERHDARRIDNQLRGRSARQGDPGESRFYLSLEDTLMRRFAPPWAARLMQKSGLKDGEPIEHKWITKSISNAQTKVEEFNFDIRKNLLEYDEVMNEQRKFIYRIRTQILRSENLDALFLEWVCDAICARCRQLAGELVLSEDKEATERDFREWFQTTFTGTFPEDPPLRELDPASLEDAAVAKFKEIYSAKSEAIGRENTLLIERYLLLTTIDHSWKEHLYTMDHLKDSIGWRGYAQVDPKIEYKREGFDIFRDMIMSMKNQIADMSVRLTVNTPENLEVESVYKDGRAYHPDAQSAGNSEASPERPEQEITKPIVNTERRVGRNDACPCGSGKKYKQCCMIVTD
ncbi:MAG: preprotein translocase subunit SecA [Planctomycetes bacterium]|nr:preprotein translocase subunit SecA [Planctomycetota bacterium]